MKWTNVGAFLLAFVAAISSEDVFDMERDLQFVAPRVAKARPQTPRDCTTNAECLQKRMPLLPPKPKRTGPLKPRESPCVPASFKGYLRAYNATNNNPIGYVSARQGVLGLYGVFTNEVSQALGIEFEACPNAVLSSVDLMIRPSQRALDGNVYPYLGAFVNWYNGETPDVGPGTALLYLSAMSQSSGFGAQPNCVITGSYMKWNGPPRDIPWYVESTVWNYNPVSRAISATWVNYGGGTYTGGWAIDTRVSTLRGNQLAVKSDNLPTIGNWTLLNMYFDPIGVW